MTGNLDKMFDQLLTALQTAEEQGYNSLNYSACHDCVLLPETSCESRNALLDRVSVVGTPEEPNLGFFGEFLFGL